MTSQAQADDNNPSAPWNAVDEKGLPCEDCERDCSLEETMDDTP